MPRQVTHYTVFLSSPGDVGDERERTATVIGEINRGIAAEKNIALDLIRWEVDGWPGIGSDPQAILNDELPAPDIFVGVMWRRLGTVTPRAESGTAEEFERACKIWQQGQPIEILTYFNEKPFFSSAAEEMKEFLRVTQFRDQLSARGVFYGRYNGPEDFESKLRQHLTAIVRKLSDRNIPHVPPARAQALLGYWEGEGVDTFVENEKAKIHFDASINFSKTHPEILGMAVIEPRVGHLTQRLAVTGSFYDGTYLQLLYRSADSGMIQAGVIVFELQPVPTELTGYYAGFSPLRRSFISGTLKLRKTAQSNLTN